MTGPRVLETIGGCEFWDVQPRAVDGGPALGARRMSAEATA